MSCLLWSVSVYGQLDYCQANKFYSELNGILRNVSEIINIANISGQHGGLVC